MRKNKTIFLAFFLLTLIIPSFTYAGTIINISKEKYILSTEKASTFGLKSDGTLLYTGRIPYEHIQALSDIDNIIEEKNCKLYFIGGNNEVTKNLASYFE